MGCRGQSGHGVDSLLNTLMSISSAFLPHGYAPGSDIQRLNLEVIAYVVTISRAREANAHEPGSWTQGMTPR